MTMRAGTKARRHTGTKGADPRLAAPAFTLTEMLIVVGIIVLVAVIAVPSFRAMTGGRSTEAAENQISAMLARARTEALGVQEARGVIFFRDPQTQRVGMAAVRASSEAVPWALDFVPDRDTVLLPNGVSVQGIDDAPDDRYVGFNLRVNNADTFVVPYGPVILFDGQGRLVSDPIAFRTEYPDPDGGGPLTERAGDLARFFFDNPGLNPGAATIPTAPLAYSKIGLVLYESEEFNSLHNDGRQADFDPQVEANADGAEAAEEEWLDANATPLLVNRYNGTLLAGE